MAASAPEYMEYRIVLPYISLEELEIALLYTLCTTYLEETGGGEGIEIVANEPYEKDSGEKGQYYHKILHLASKVPRTIRMLAPKGSLEISAKTWNNYPQIKTVYSNPDYMKNNFHLDVQTMFVENDKGTHDNVFGLDEEKLSKRVLIELDIVNDPVSSADYKEDTDPSKVRLEKTNRGPLNADWKDTETKFLTVYMFTEVEFKWFGLQDTVQSRIQKANTRIYRNFYRTLICSLDKCHGMTMDDIRKLEEQTKLDLDKARSVGEVRGMMEQ